MKAVAYCATRNLYPRLPTAINSLLTNNKGIDKVYLFLEDDDCVLFRDKRIEIINVTKLEQYLWKESANYDTVFTYMSLIRLCFPMYLPNVDKVLYLDVDTIVDDNIEELFDIDMKTNIIVGTEDLINIKGDGGIYINAGVMLMNLKEMRVVDFTHRVLPLINSDKRLLYPDQDAMNITASGKKIVISSIYNTFCTKQSKEKPKIVHYAGFKTWWDKATPMSEYYQKYKCVSI